MSEFKWQLVPAEPTREMWAAVNKEDDSSYAGGCHHGASFEQLWSAALAAAPQPPALAYQEFSVPDCPDCACVQDGECLCIPSKSALGGELETLAWLVDDSKDGHRSVFRNDPTGWAHGYQVRELVDRAHVDRLQAEVERYKSIESVQEGAALVFDYLKMAACNTSDDAWSEELEELAAAAIEYAPRYKRNWKDIVKLAAEIEQLKAGNAELERLLRKGATVVEQFMPNVAKCSGVDFQAVNEFLVGVSRIDAALAEGAKS